MKSPSLLRTLLISSVSVLAIAAVGCGKKSDKPGSTSLTSATTAGPRGGSCLQEKAGSCSEYKDNVLGISESTCKDLIKGTYTKDACPTANLMATCDRKGDKKFYYYGGSQPWLSDAQKSCEKDGLEPGKFEAQPNAEQLSKDKALPADDKIQGSCVKDGGCEDLYGEMFDLQKSMCEQFDGKFATGTCASRMTSDKVVGSCVMNGKVQRLYAKDLKFQKMSDLQHNCETLAIPFGHFYPAPDAPKAGAPAAPGGAKTGAAKPASTGAAKAKK